MWRLMAMCVLAGLLAQPAQLAIAAKKPPLVPPHITVQTVAALPPSSPQRFRVTLRIDNLNAEPLTIKALEFKLKLASEGVHLVGLKLTLSETTHRIQHIERPAALLRFYGLERFDVLIFLTNFFRRHDDSVVYD